jgi:hypothetical protein
VPRLSMSQTVIRITSDVARPANKMYSIAQNKMRATYDLVLPNSYCDKLVICLSDAVVGQ